MTPSYGGTLSVTQDMRILNLPEPNSEFILINDSANNVYFNIDHDPPEVTTSDMHIKQDEWFRSYWPRSVSRVCMRCSPGQTATIRYFVR